MNKVLACQDLDHKVSDAACRPLRALVRAIEAAGSHRVPIEAAGPSRAIGAASRASYRSHRAPPRANRGRGTLARYRSRE
eukprot:1304005-Prymnesium_polylepis.1